MISDDVYDQYLSFLLSGNRNNCTNIVQELLARDVELKALYTRLFQRALYKIGELWEMNKISVAVEHMATSITESLITMIYPQIFSAEHIDKRAIISCVANEYHQVGARMVADIFELNRWDGYFLGSNTPLNDLMKMIDEKKPDIVGLSLAIYFNMPSLLSILEKLKTNYPQLDIFVGGQAFQWGGADTIKKFKNVEYIPSLDKLERLISD